MLVAPLVAGESVVCTGIYTLEAEDVDNLMRESLATVEAKDEYGYEVTSSAADTVTLEQVSIQRYRPGARSHGFMAWVPFLPLSYPHLPRLRKISLSGAAPEASIVR